MSSNCATHGSEPHFNSTDGRSSTGSTNCTSYAHRKDDEHSSRSVSVGQPLTEVNLATHSRALASQRTSDHDLVQGWLRSIGPGERARVNTTVWGRLVDNDPIAAAVEKEIKDYKKVQK